MDGILDTWKEVLENLESKLKDVEIPMYYSGYQSGMDMYYSDDVHNFFEVVSTKKEKLTSLKTAIVTIKDLAEQCNNAWDSKKSSVIDTLTEKLNGTKIQTVASNITTKLQNLINKWDVLGEDIGQLVEECNYKYNQVCIILDKIDNISVKIETNRALLRGAFNYQSAIWGAMSEDKKKEYGNNFYAFWNSNPYNGQALQSA